MSGIVEQHQKSEQLILPQTISLSSQSTITANIRTTSTQTLSTCTTRHPPLGTDNTTYDFTLARHQPTTCTGVLRTSKNKLLKPPPPRRTNSVFVQRTLNFTGSSTSTDTVTTTTNTQSTTQPSSNTQDTNLSATTTASRSNKQSSEDITKDTTTSSSNPFAKYAFNPSKPA